MSLAYLVNALIRDSTYTASRRVRPNALFPNPYKPMCGSHKHNRLSSQICRICPQAGMDYRGYFHIHRCGIHCDSQMERDEIDHADGAEWGWLETFAPSGRSVGFTLDGTLVPLKYLEAKWRVSFCYGLLLFDNPGKTILYYNLHWAHSTAD